MRGSSEKFIRRHRRCNASFMPHSFFALDDAAATGESDDRHPSLSIFSHIVLPVRWHHMNAEPSHRFISRTAKAARQLTNARRFPGLRKLNGLVRLTIGPPLRSLRDEPLPHFTLFNHPGNSFLGVSLVTYAAIRNLLDQHNFKCARGSKGSKTAAPYLAAVCPLNDDDNLQDLAEKPRDKARAIISHRFCQM